jgi:hypothetical protein
VRVGDKRALEVVKRLGNRFNDLEPKLGRLVAKGGERAI